MGKGIKSKKSERASGFAKEIIGMGLMLFSVLSLLCLITGDVIFYTLGQYVQGFYLGLFGYFSFVVLALTVLLGFRLLTDKSLFSAQVKGKIALVLLFAFSVLAIIETATSFDRGLGFAKNWSNAYGGGKHDFSTSATLGAMALLIINPLGSLLSSVGCYVIFSLLAVLSVLLLFKKQIFRSTKKRNVGKKPQAKKVAQDKRAKETKVAEKDEPVKPVYDIDSDEAEEKPVYRRPGYIGSTGDFGMKSKRDYAKEGRQISVFDGSFTMRNGKNSYSSDTYSNQYRKDLSPEARYIMSPPPVRPEDIGQPPIKADNPANAYRDGREQAPGYDDYALGGSVYTVKNDSRGFDRSRESFTTDSGYESEPRGGLFDNVSSDRRTQTDSVRDSRASFNNDRREPFNNDRRESFSNDRRESFNNDRPAYTRDGRTRDIEERLGVDKGKRRVPDEDDTPFSGTDEARNTNDYSFGGDIPNVENAYTPGTTANGGLFGSASGFNQKENDVSQDTPFDNASIFDDLPKSNVPDQNANDDVFLGEERGTTRGATRATERSVGADTSPLRGGTRENANARTPRSETSTAGFTGNRTNPSSAKGAESSEDVGEFTSSTASEISKFSDEYDPNEGYSSIEDMPMNYRYVKPSTDLLADTFVDESKVLSERQRLMDLARLVETNFSKRGISVRLENIVYGMTITRFEYSIPTETSVKCFTQNQGDIAVWLHAKGEIRIIAPIPGTSKIGVEVPNQVRSTVGLKELICSPQYRKIKNDGIYIPAGKNVMAEPVFLNLTDMPHLLIAGATGKGKSVFLNAMLVSLLYTYSPEDLRIVIVDPKQLEFVSFEGIPHLLFNKIITKAEEAAALLSYLVKEMEDRYTLFAKAKVKKIAHYNAAIDRRTTKKLPYIIVLIDEFADLMMQNLAAKKDMDQSITRLAQLARAAGISLVFATQRPTTDVIDGTIKNNFPARICFKTADYTNSQVVIGENGAEKLLGKGDLLYKVDGPSERAQGALVEDAEIERVVSFVNERNKCYYDKKLFEYINKMAKCFGQTQSAEREGQISMDLGESGNPADMPVVYRRAVRLVIVQNTTSKSMLQTKLGIGYNKAARIIDWMEKQGFISYVLDNKQREIRIDRQTYEEVFGEPFDEDYTK